MDSSAQHLQIDSVILERTQAPYKGVGTPFLEESTTP